MVAIGVLLYEHCVHVVCLEGIHQNVGSSDRNDETVVAEASLGCGRRKGRVQVGSRRRTLLSFYDERVPRKVTASLGKRCLFWQGGGSERGSQDCDAGVQALKTAQRDPRPAQHEKERRSQGRGSGMVDDRVPKPSVTAARTGRRWRRYEGFLP